MFELGSIAETIESSGIRGRGVENWVILGGSDAIGGVAPYKIDVFFGLFFCGFVLFKYVNQAIDLRDPLSCSGGGVDVSDSIDLEWI